MFLYRLANKLHTCTVQSTAKQREIHAHTHEDFCLFSFSFMFYINIPDLFLYKDYNKEKRINMEILFLEFCNYSRFGGNFSGFPSPSTIFALTVVLAQTTEKPALSNLGIVM